MSAAAPAGSAVQASPSKRVQAVEENLLGHVSYVQERLAGMSVRRRGGVVVVDSGLASDTFNKVLAARFTEEEADRRIAEVLREVEETGRPFTWWAGPCSRPLDLEERLRRHGLEESERELGMTLDLAKAPADVPLPAGTTIRKVETPDDLAAFAGVLAGLADPPDESVRSFFERAGEVVLQPGCPMRFFVAEVEGVPAAVSELFLGGGVAGVHMVATADAYRRRGLGMALTWRALDEGRRAGFEVGALQASQEGQPVYEKLGFTACGVFVEYALA